MQPHTVALINIAAYINNGGSGTRFKVYVTFNTRKYYDIDVSGSGSTLSCTVGGLWTCSATLRFEGGGKVSVRHTHRERTLVQEEVYLSGTTMYGGRITDSNIKDGSFSGKIREGGKEIEITANTTGYTYQSHIQ